MSEAAGDFYFLDGVGGGVGGFLGGFLGGGGGGTFPFFPSLDDRVGMRVLTNIIPTRCI